MIVTDDVVNEIENAIQFAPLHNPAHLIGIREAFKLFPHLKDKNVVVFDTAFHQTMPEEAYLYALPYSLYKEHGVRRYGAHGTSHYFVSREAAKRLLAIWVTAVLYLPFVTANVSIPPWA